MNEKLSLANELWKVAESLNAATDKIEARASILYKIEALLNKNEEDVLEGYPDYLPSLDEVAMDFRAWAIAIRDKRYGIKL